MSSVSTNPGGKQVNESFRTRPRAGFDMLRQIRHMARTTAGRGEEGREGQDKAEEKDGFKIA